MSVQARAPQLRCSQSLFSICPSQFPAMPDWCVCHHCRNICWSLTCWRVCSISRAPQLHPFPSAIPLGLRPDACNGRCPPRTRMCKKNGSSCVRWPAIAGAHPGLAVEKKRLFFLWRLRTMASLIPLQPRAWSCSYSSGISACDTMGYDSLQSDCL